MGKSWKKWNPGDRHLMNQIQWDQRELDGLESVLEGDWFGYGEFNRLFEQGLSTYTGIPNFYLTNSGSAAIEVGLLALKNLGYWQPGDKVLHPVTTFATSISSAINLGLVPVFIETVPNMYVADPRQIERAILTHPDIKGMVLPHLLGNVPDMRAIKDLLGNRFLLEDCCDTLGSTYASQHVGSFGDIAAFSFYGSHHITSGGVGGALATRSTEIGEIVKSLIFWGRDFSYSDGDFLKRYTYQTLGTDSQMTNLQAAFGVKQLEKLPGFVSSRASQFQEITQLFEEFRKYFDLPETLPLAKPSWFAYPLTVKESAPFGRDSFAEYLMKQGVEVRPLMCGNITLQKPFNCVKRYSLDNDSFPIGNRIEERSLFIPCWGMPLNQRRDYHEKIAKFLEDL